MAFPAVISVYLILLYVLKAGLDCLYIFTNTNTSSTPETKRNLYISNVLPSVRKLPIFEALLQNYETQLYKLVQSINIDKTCISLTWGGLHIFHGVIALWNISVSHKKVPTGTGGVDPNSQFAWSL